MKEMSVPIAILWIFLAIMTLISFVEASGHPTFRLSFSRIVRAVSIPILLGLLIQFNSLYLAPIANSTLWQSFSASKVGNGFLFFLLIAFFSVGAVPLLFAVCALIGSQLTELPAFKNAKSQKEELDDQRLI